MNVSLTATLEKFIDGKVRSGRYHSASEVVREALRLLEDQDRGKEARGEFHRELKGRLAALDRDETIAPEQVRQRLRRKSRERKRLTA